MKKVLIITYYWPPSGGAGVQRWLKFTKYLSLYGWQPVIYTPENPEAPAIDESLLQEIPINTPVIKNFIWEPYQAYKRFTGQKKDDRISAGFLSEKKKPALAEKISVWIRGNLFIPDSRKYWIKPSVKFLNRYLKENPVNAIISTGPPHSMHLIALGIKKKLDIPWLADFRDPWTKIDFYDKLMLTKLADLTHKRQEKAVLANADKCVTVSWSWAEDMRQMAGREIDVITNGFDPADFDQEVEVRDDHFILQHIGSLNKDRNPGFLWEVLGELCRENSEFRKALKIRFVGQTDYSVLEDIRKNDLSKYAEKVDYLPHVRVVKEIKKASALLLLINNTFNFGGIIPGKLFEYLAARRPILCIGPENGDSARIIRETSSGIVINFGDKPSLKKNLVGLFEKWKSGKTSNESNDIDKYSRKNLTGKMAKLLDEIT